MSTVALKINRYAAEELKAMLPTAAVLNGAVILVSVVIGLIYGFDWRVFSGLAAGNALMLANFILIGYTAEKTVKLRDFRRARFLGNLSYGLRYIGIFVILAALLTLDVIAVVTAVIPLFYPKVYYTFIYVRKHGKDEE